MRFHYQVLIIFNESKYIKNTPFSVWDKTMQKIYENSLIEIIKKYKTSDDSKKSKECLDIMVASIAYISKLRPHFAPDNPLSIREMMCLILLSVGKNPDQCGDLLGITAMSVRSYEKRIRRKLGARNRTHAFYLAAVKGFIQLAV